MNGDRTTLTIAEGVNGKVHMITKFEPSITEEQQDAAIEGDFEGLPHTHVAAIVAAGAASDYFIQLHADQEAGDS